MTADQLRECREAFEKAHEEIYGAHPPGTLPNGRWRLWQIAWNTRPTAVSSHAEGDWRMADLWVEYAANGNIRYFTQDPESADVRRESIASEGRELVVYYTHPPRSGDEARDATRWRAARDNQGDGLRLIMWNHKAVEELQVMFPSKSLCEEYADAAMAARGGEKSCSGT